MTAIFPLCYRFHAHAQVEWKHAMMSKLGLAGICGLLAMEPGVAKAASYSLSPVSGAGLSNVALNHLNASGQSVGVAVQSATSVPVWWDGQALNVLPPSPAIANSMSPVAITVGWVPEGITDTGLILGSVTNLLPYTELAIFTYRPANRGFTFASAITTREQFNGMIGFNNTCNILENWGSGGDNSLWGTVSRPCQARQSATATPFRPGLRITAQWAVFTAPPILGYFYISTENIIIRRCHCHLPIILISSRIFLAG